MQLSILAIILEGCVRKSETCWSKELCRLPANAVVVEARGTEREREREARSQDAGPFDGGYLVSEFGSRTFTFGL